MQAPLEFGWFLPTSGDTTCYGDSDSFIPPSAELFDRVILAAEAAGFEYFLVPVSTTCWEAWISSAMAVAKTKRIKALVAARPAMSARCNWPRWPRRSTSCQAVVWR